MEKSNHCHPNISFCPNLSSFCDSNSRYVRRLLVIFFFQSFLSIPWDQTISIGRASSSLIISSLLSSLLLTTNSEFLISIIVLLFKSVLFFNCFHLLQLSSIYQLMSYYLTHQNIYNSYFSLQNPYILQLNI